MRVFDLNFTRTLEIIKDASTTGIAGPVVNLVREATSENIPVVPILGPVAIVPAFVASGLPTDRIVLENFLPAISGSGRKALESIKIEP